MIHLSRKKYFFFKFWLILDTRAWNNLINESIFLSGFRYFTASFHASSLYIYISNYKTPIIHVACWNVGRVEEKSFLKVSRAHSVDSGSPMFLSIGEHPTRLVKRGEKHIRTTAQVNKRVEKPSASRVFPWKWWGIWEGAASSLGEVAYRRCIASVAFPLK